MTQTAAALSTEQALNLSQSPTSPLIVLTSGNTTKALSVQRSSKGSKHQSTKSKPDEIINNVQVDGQFYTSTSQLSYGDKVKLSFSVKEAYRAHFTLIKGLLDFHRAPAYTFTFDKTEGTFDVVTGTGATLAIEELYRFLSKIATWLDQELSFKKQLKEMIAFEREYRAKLAKVYANSEGYTLRPLV